MNDVEVIPQPRERGKIGWVNLAAGWCYVHPNPTEKLFLHFSQLGGGREYMKVGSTVEYNRQPKVLGEKCDRAINSVVVEF